MVCTLSPKQLELLLEKVAKDLFTMIEQGKPLNIKQYVSSIYDRVNSITKDPARAQTYAALIPSNILSARSASKSIKKLIV